MPETLVRVFWLLGWGGGSPNGAQLFETRVLCLAGTLLTTVELDTASHNPKKNESRWKDFLWVCEIHDAQAKYSSATH